MEIPFVEWDDFLAKFRWKQGEHLTMVGPTGGGKTTLALQLLPRRKFVVVFATKKRDPLISKLKNDGYETMPTFTGTRELGDRIILQPPMTKGTRSLRDQQRVFRHALETIFRQTGWAVYLDEARYVCDYLNLAMDCELLLQQGRSLGVTMIAGTQRPVKIPLAFYDQATHLFFWRDNDDANLKRLGGLGGIDRRLVIRAVSVLRSHQVLYLNTRTGDLARTKVRL